MFSVSDRARQKMVARMNELNRGQGDVVDCLAGRAQFRWTTGAITAMAIAGVAMVLLFLLTQQVAVPGALLVLYIFNSVRPPRVVGITDSEVLVAARSFWNAKASQIVARAPFGSAGHRPEGRTLIVGDEHVTFNTKEHARLQAIVSASGA